MSKGPTFFLFANPYKPDTVATSAVLARLLFKQGARVLMSTWLHERVQVGEPCALEQLPQTTTAVVSLGGDGTLLRTISHAAARGIPVLGIHMGHVGFLL